MALTHNFKAMNTSSNTSMSDLGSKVKNVAEVVGAVKGLYDMGKMIYHGAQTIAPFVRPLLLP